MITLPVVISICVFILGITFTLMKIIYDIVTKRIEQLEKTRDNHEKRIQHIEDLHGRDIEEIKRILTELSSDVKALNKYIHKDNHDLIDFIKQQGDIIQLIHRHMETKN
jgi:5-bromo-4-chloroindolyl phosphate hydrolysis protein